MNNADHIERLREEIAAGESSMDTPMKVFGTIGQIDRPLADEFSKAYEEYAENEDEIPAELIERVCASMAIAPEYEDPFHRKPLII